ncbi:MULTISPECIES: 3-dehydroquinate synthase [unclassified Wenzhouxiangella]|uniref:3-dehydroquinate synthase n=1 Tax=unclassified Wenzhouxiangella TaxID=2613841 RepID=UPI000E32A32A|nr:MULTISPECIES: 3-dehydroquinate synthase [unclassified Wenzhouxiangella]RFF26940.1 3-dehydroquinate synthase [Wenzhouxiangella sp. 15181]RFP69453.1 3-dehydroquinate synthase [Wenzhouxiangella sp. 15190]
MKVTQVHTAGGSYPVYVGQGLLAMASIWQRHLEGRVLVVSDETVAGLYLDRVGRILDEDRRWRSLVLPAGEAAKTVAHWQQVLDELVDMGAQRDATVLALGGGVIGDLAGFAAASYMRGIRIVQMPTTLLAQVDAAVGGKTGVNHASGKNLIGAFHQPAAVVADIDTLISLEDRDYRAGLAEVVKYGAIRDERFFSWLESRAEPLNARMPDALLEAVHASVTHKAEVVAADEREAGERALLNFGHTFGHALETATGYARYRHGEAVAIGMVLGARLSELLGKLRLGTSERLVHLLEHLGLPTTLPEDINRDRLLALMRLDKKNRADRIRVVLLEEVGRAVVETCPADDIREVLERS